MRTLAVLMVSVLWLACSAPAQNPRFVINDDEYDQKVVEAGVKLLHAGKLLSQDALRHQLHTRGQALKLTPVSHQKLEAPDLYDRLRQSTLAVGMLYKCSECNEWHFNSSAGFVVAEGGVVSTCCHVVMATDDGVRESYLVAADAPAHVYPVRAVLAADTDADTCLLKIDAPALKPLPLRPGARIGERVYCLSHPGGYHFMFTQGMVSRLNSQRNDVLDEQGKSTGELTRPILFLNVTAEFAPGSSGGPVVDEACNVVAQVASIADAGEPTAGDATNAPSPSVPVRFCTATEEILHLTDPKLVEQTQAPHSKKPAAHPKPEVRKLKDPAK